MDPPTGGMSEFSVMTVKRNLVRRCVCACVLDLRRSASASWRGALAARRQASRRARAAATAGTAARKSRYYTH